MASGEPIRARANVAREPWASVLAALEDEHARARVPSRRERSGSRARAVADPVTRCVKRRRRRSDARERGSDGGARGTPRCSRRDPHPPRAPRGGSRRTSWVPGSASGAMRERKPDERERATQRTRRRSRFDVSPSAGARARPSRGRRARGLSARRDQAPGRTPPLSAAFAARSDAASDLARDSRAARRGPARLAGQPDVPGRVALAHRRAP